MHRKKFLNLAAEGFRKAAQRKPDFAQAHHRLGKVYQELGEKDKARQAYEAALKLAPDLREAKMDLEKLNKGK